MPRRRRRIRIPLVLAVVSIVAAIVLYVFGVAWLQSRAASTKPSDLYIPRSIDVLVCVWLFWVGSAVGSFLNVVAWRMPRGEGVGGRSYCPRCKTQLSARDNFPVFGWLALGGRCRTCRLPISPRYPIVEAAVGTSVTLVGFAEFYRWSLPEQVALGHGGAFGAPVVDKPLLLILLYHCVALAVVWAMGLIRGDGKRLPSSLILFAMTTTIVPMLAYPTLMVLPWQVEFPANWEPQGLYLDAAIRVVTALAMAVVLARYLARGLCPGADPKLDPLGQRTARLIDLIVIIAVPAIIVGWQASGMLVFLASLIASLFGRWLRSPSDALGRLAIAMPCALTLQLMFWRWLHQFWLWPSAGSSPWVILASLGLLFFAPLWLHESQSAAIAPRPIEGEDAEADPVSLSQDPVAEQDDS